jgi:hypothetical protein
MCHPEISQVKEDVAKGIRRKVTNEDTELAMTPIQGLSKTLSTQ